LNSSPPCLPVHCYCCLLERLKLLLRLKLWLKLMLHSAQLQGKRGEGITCSNSHTKGQTQMGKEKGKESCQPFSLHVHTTSQVHSSTAPAPLFYCQVPELPLQLLMVPLLSSQPQLGTGASEISGCSHWLAGSCLFILNHPQNH